MELDKKSICKVFQVPSEALKNIEAGPKQEPKIISGNLNNEELLEWMAKKVSTARQLKSALAERDSCKQALSEIEVRISLLTNSAALELLSTTQDPTHLP
ncbi:hypothetical protein ACRRQX_004114 [Yersinia enterocolitica]|uniref:hypothetical protein n=1 Tax=Yersinia enterocolitica TaxID=630 RepID=UPI0005E772EB|nr:hypothetical protein [Yersinia enterocolitica]EKN4723963.1 hypothetical protein [Yersinia enterocolitica]EKN4735003.1 hypothetical protein [Yersinia enterocolitica]EKN4861465.1 hypothetical protein [Yersinia enterocolitica]ELI7915335.1 hypothetical protein [Yersinia enterocolitica]ELI7928961.1 hypothetical protein [Yersinia enterocolitica]